MLFRIWCLYISKLVYVVAALFTVTFFAPSMWLRNLSTTIAFAILIPLGITGALLAVWLFALKKPLACPRCGTPGKLVSITKYDVGVDCVLCGLVHANCLTSFQLRVEPPEDVNGDKQG